MTFDDIQNMSRPEVIFELAKHAHPQHYHSLLQWKTKPLRHLLAYYKGFNRVLKVQINVSQEMEKSV